MLIVPSHQAASHAFHQRAQPLVHFIYRQLCAAAVPGVPDNA
jgi:hypothetical protein